MPQKFNLRCLFLPIATFAVIALSSATVWADSTTINVGNATRTELASMLLLGTGLIGVAGAVRRRFRK